MKVKENTKFKKGDRVKCINNDGWCRDIIGRYGVVVEVRENDYAVEFDKFMDGHSCNGNAKHGYGWYCTNKMLEIVSQETIVIYRKDQKVIALDKSTGKKAIARCCPEDTFDFEIGAKLAFERLTGPKKPSVIKQERYQVGDKVLIVDHWNNKTNHNSSGKMDKWLGKVMTIREIKGILYRMEEDVDEGFDGGWYWNRYCIAGKIVGEKLTAEPPKSEYLNTHVVFDKGNGLFTPDKVYEINRGKITANDGTPFPLCERFRTMDNVVAYFGSGSGYNGCWFNSNNPCHVMEVHL